jgi:cytochrome c peroxidase
LSVLAALALAACGLPEAEPSESDELGIDTSNLDRDLYPFANPTGLLLTISKTGRIDRNNPFFQSLGTNGRTCETCHAASQAWTLSPLAVRARFTQTDGLDPLFRRVDGANSPRAPAGTVAERRAAYSMLLSKALIRVGIGVPANAEFELIAVDDPYGYASAAELSLFRRPLPSANLDFLSGIMWDGRETVPGESIHFDLKKQSNDATLGHAEATSPLTEAQRDAIVAMETSLLTAQAYDSAAGVLWNQNARGGPIYLLFQPFYIGINDPLGGNPTGEPFDPRAFRLYDPWRSASLAARRQIARGQAIFNTRGFVVSGVGGLNDELNAPAITATCTLCHDSPNVGNHSVSLPVDIGLSDASLRTPDMPLYTLRNKATGEVVRVTDPGRALITGKWKDMAKFKGPVLRGLAGRAPYFHNGSAATLADVVNFYDTRFSIGLTTAEKADLAAFLRAL